MARIIKMTRHEFKDRVDSLLVRTHIKGVGYNIKTTIYQRDKNGNNLDLVVLVPIPEEEKVEEFGFLQTYKGVYWINICNGQWTKTPEEVAEIINKQVF